MLSPNSLPLRVPAHTLSYPYLLIPEKQEVGSEALGVAPPLTLCCPGLLGFRLGCISSCSWGSSCSSSVSSSQALSHRSRGCRRTPCGSPHPSTGPTLSPGFPRCPQRPGRWPGWWRLQVFQRVTPRWSRPCRGCSSRSAQCRRPCAG